MDREVLLTLGRSKVEWERMNCGMFLYWHGRLIEVISSSCFIHFIFIYYEGYFSLYIYYEARKNIVEANFSTQVVERDSDKVLDVKTAIRFFLIN